MSTILNIETSGRICSVALTSYGEVVYQLEDEEEMAHSTQLAPFVDKAMEEVRRKGLKLDAVAVSIGPGSYTGLRIGLSMAKGLAFGLGVPLIGVPTLKILAVKAMFMARPWTGDEILMPMIDARRMEVFTAAYDFGLTEVMKAGPMLLEEGGYKRVTNQGKKVIFIGTGSEKAKKVVKEGNVEWLSSLEPHARDMMALSEKAFRENDFIDIAYSVPEYLKEYQTTKPKNKI